MALAPTDLPLSEQELALADHLEKEIDEFLRRNYSTTTKVYEYRMPYNQTNPKNNHLYASSTPTIQQRVRTELCNRYRATGWKIKDENFTLAFSIEK